MPTVHLLIKGKVQGVYFRASARDVAATLDVTGLVRNTPEGHVEAEATGSEHALQQFIEWCRRGPKAAQVASLNVTAIAEKNFADFRQIRS